MPGNDCGSTNDLIDECREPVGEVCELRSGYTDRGAFPVAGQINGKDAMRCLECFDLLIPTLGSESNAMDQYDWTATTCTMICNAG